MQSITVQELAQKQKSSSVDLIDVRMPTEYREVHATGAVSVPLDSLDPKAVAKAMQNESGEPIYVICKSGNRSSKAVQKFLQAGVQNVVNVDGGTNAWVSAGLPIVRGQKAISLERQVRILAGFLALLGAVLGFFVHPYFIGLSAFIGAGLMFAGITDTCGMGMMLSKMPWNRCGDSGSCSV
ncbi:rhodanese domain-containing protein [Rhodopirellula baltica SH28]|uniref:Rhodanese domain-containing protein n=2 Tax=Rhodopirellula baltica TaxID=265606 RepID=K5DCE6_RHOBT|nr:rhodanese-like domain-containing protein [Rhodopirellula baltica]EKK04397.1 rhodanese domain-containing protein [Rhodopirellula baltica SH28]ELP31033.1 rhodanese domain-containing protein [Rhodopirellula baltica SWK14]